MARIPSLQLSMGPAVGYGNRVDVTFLGKRITFASSSLDAMDMANFWRFRQVESPNVLAGQVGQNVASLANVFKRYLEFIQETRFEVTYVVRQENGFEMGGTVTIKAREYSADLNLPYEVSNFASEDTGMSAVGVTNDNPPTVTVSAFDLTCLGNASGVINLQVQGGYPPYNFLWSDGSTEQNRSGLAASKYTLTVTDSAVPQPLYPELPPDSPYQVYGPDIPGVVVREITLGQPTRIELIARVNGQEVALEASGGTPGYTFLWEDGSTEQVRNGVTPGDYEVVVTDAAGCQRRVNVHVGEFRFFFSRNPITLELSATELESKPNLSFLCEVWVEREYLSGVFETVTASPLEQPADSSGKTVFDVRELLDAYVSPFRPAFRGNGVERAEGAFTRFYLKYTEKYGSPATIGPYTQVASQYVLCGGLSEAEHFAETFFSSYLPNRKPFFSWTTTMRRVYADQPEFLYFLPNDFSITSFRVMARLRFADGTTRRDQLFEQAGVLRYELWCIPAGYDQLQLATRKEGSPVKSWDIYVTDQQGNVISETRRFHLRHPQGEPRRFLVYANSLGGTDTLAATGKAKLKLDPDSTFLEKSLLPGMDPGRGTVEVRSKVGKPTLELTTGYGLRKEELPGLQDFLLAEQVYLVGSDRYVPVTVPDKTQTVFDEMEDLPYLDFDVQLPTVSRYTPALRLAGYEDRSAELSPLEI